SPAQVRLGRDFRLLPHFGLLSDRWIGHDNVEPTNERLVEDRAATGNAMSNRGLGQGENNAGILATIWRMVEDQRVGAARHLLNERPDTPEYARVKRLLRRPATRTDQRRDRPRTAEYEWLRSHSDEFRGRWVALSGDALIATSTSLRELREQLRSISASAT